MFVLQKHVSLESAYSGEGPAASARSLVLDWSNTSVLPPVPVFWELVVMHNHSMRHVWSLGGRAVLLGSGSLLVKFEELNEFLIGHIRELVDSLGISLICLAVMLDNSLD